MNIPGDLRKFVHSLEQARPQHEGDVRPVSYMHGKVYQKNSKMFRFLRGLAKVCFARSGKSERYTEYLEKLLRVKQLGNQLSPRAKLLADWQISLTFHKIIQPVVLRRIDPAKVEVLAACLESIDDPNERVHAIWMLRRCTAEANLPAPLFEQCNDIINRFSDQLFAPDQLSRLNITNLLHLIEMNPERGFDETIKNIQNGSDLCRILDEMNKQLLWFLSDRVGFGPMFIQITSQILTQDHIDRLSNDEVNLLSQNIFRFRRIYPDALNAIDIANKLGSLNLTGMDEEKKQSLRSIFDLLISDLYNRREGTSVFRLISDAHPEYLNQNSQNILKTLSANSQVRDEILDEGIRPKPVLQETFWRGISKIEEQSDSVIDSPVIGQTLFISENVLSHMRASPNEEWNRKFWTDLQDRLTANVRHVVFQGTVMPYSRSLLNIAAEMSLTAKPVPDPKKLLNLAFVNITPGSEALLSIGTEGPMLPQLLLDLKPKSISEEAYHAALAFVSEGTNPQTADREEVQKYLNTYSTKPANYFNGKLLITPPRTDDRNTYVALNQFINRKYWPATSVVLSSIPQPGQQPTYREITNYTWARLYNALETGRISYQDIFTPVEIGVENSDEKPSFSLAELKLLMPKHAKSTMEEWGKFQLKEEEMRMLLTARDLLLFHRSIPTKQIVPVLAFMQEQGVATHLLENFARRFLPASVQKSGEHTSFYALSPHIRNVLLNLIWNEKVTFKDLMTPMEISFGENIENKLTLSRAELKILMPMYFLRESDQWSDSLQLSDEEDRAIFDAYYQMKFNDVQPDDERIGDILALMHEQGITGDPHQVKLERRLIDIFEAETEEGVKPDRKMFKYLYNIAQSEDLKRYLATHLNKW